MYCIYYAGGVCSNLSRRRTRIPTYSFSEHARTDKWLPIYGANVIIFEGIYALYDPRVLALTDLKVFVETPLDICLARRLARDIVQRGRHIGLSVEQWSRFVKPNFERHMRHTMYNADIRIPKGINNTVAIEMLIAHIRQQLQKKSNKHLDHLLTLNKPSDGSKSVALTNGDSSSSDDKDGHEYFKLQPRPANLTIIKQTNQVRALHTILLNTTQTSRADFVFYFNRIAEILLNEALAHLDDGFYKTIPEIISPTGAVIRDSVRPAGPIAAVSMIRGGGCFEQALRRVLGGDGRTSKTDGGIGKVLIQSDPRTGEPHLHALSLPPCIDPRQTKDGTLNSADCTAQAAARVLLLDSQLASGAAITMAAAILVDHGVKEENITVVTYLASDIALNRISTAFPRLKIVVAHVENRIYPRFIDSMYYGV